jgi:single-strand DNA-binding protein
MIQLIIAGRIGKDAETRTTQGGKSVTGFSVASDVGFGESKKTIWVDCTIWGDRGQKLCQYLKKGSPVTVIGEGGMREWESNGKHGASMTCNVREIELHGGKRDSDSGNQSGGDRGGYGGGQRSGGGSGGGSGWEPPADLDDEIPF